MSRTFSIALILAASSLPAIAATPESGTISETSLELSYTFPLAPIANVGGLPGAAVPGADPAYPCDSINPCDEFALTLDLPTDYLEKFPDASVRVAAATSEANLDIDLQIANEAGEVVYIQRDNPPAQPTIIFFPAGGIEKFTVQVAHGTPHTGGSVTVKLESGEASKTAKLLAGGGFGLGLLFPLALLALARRVR